MFNLDILKALNANGIILEAILNILLSIKIAMGYDIPLDLTQVEHSILIQALIVNGFDKDVAEKCAGMFRDLMTGVDDKIEYLIIILRGIMIPHISHYASGNDKRKMLADHNDRVSKFIKDYPMFCACPNGNGLDGNCSNSGEHVNNRGWSIVHLKLT
jgi:hypothetical protein